MENTQLEVIEANVIETALIKNNITDQIINGLKESYLGLTINGIEDKEGFKKVEEGRKEAKKLRCLAVNICKTGREEAIKIQKDWIEKEKEVVAKIVEVESHLETESNRIKEIEKQILFEAAQKAKLPVRKEKLLTIGFEVADDELLKIDDNQFNILFNEFHEKMLAEKAEKLRLEQEQIEAERKEAARVEFERLAEIKRQEDLKLAAENARIEAEKKAKEAIEKAEQAKADAEKKAIEAAKQAEIDKQLALEKAEKEKQEAIDKLKKEQEAKEAAELKAKADAEKAEKLRIENEEKARIAAEKKAAKAPDKEKLKVYLSEYKSAILPSFKNEDSQKVALEIITKFAAFKKWANEQIEAL